MVPAQAQHASVIEILYYGTAAVCGYEAVSLTTRKVPPVSLLCHRHRWLTAVVVGGLLTHLLVYAPPVAAAA